MEHNIKINKNGLWFDGDKHPDSANISNSNKLFATICPIKELNKVMVVALMTDNQLEHTISLLDKYGDCRIAGGHFGAGEEVS